MENNVGTRPERMRVTRRRLLQSSLAVTGIAACSTKLALLEVSFGGHPPIEQRLLTAPLIVPIDFVGMHAHRWPVGEPLSPAPTYNFGAVRSHDFDGVAWYHIEVAPNTFDWTRLDTWVRIHAAAGRTLIYTVYGTPSWMAESTLQKDPYGQPGGASPPKTLQCAAEFIRALILRYNGDGTHRISFVETWNEPNFVQSYNDFWWGTAEQLVALSRVLHLAVKQVDAGVRILSPGFAGNLAGSLSLASPRLTDAISSSLYQYLSAPDGFGNRGSRWCDGVAFHCYNAPVGGPNRSFVLEIQRLRRLLELMHISLPIYETEMGFLCGDSFHAVTPLEQGLILRRCAALHAGLGVKGLYFYSHDDEFVGNPALHPEVAEAIGDVHAMIAGQTLKQVTMLADGNVKVTTAERSFIW